VGGGREGSVALIPSHPKRIEKNEGAKEEAADGDVVNKRA
jgi:hypothetical protein